MPALAKVTLTEDAKAIMTEHNALPARRALGGLEGASLIDMAVLHSLGAGTATGMMLKDCTTAAECAQARQDIAIELLKLRRDHRRVPPAHDRAHAAVEASGEEAAL